MPRKIEDLREHLFATLEDLRNKHNPMDLDRAKATASVAQTLINSYTLQVRAINALGGSGGDGFIRELTGEGADRPKLPAPPRPAPDANEKTGIAAVRRAEPKAS
jgi:hypothetical protein